MRGGSAGYAELRSPIDSLTFRTIAARTESRRCRRPSSCPGSTAGRMWPHRRRSPGSNGCGRRNGTERQASARNRMASDPRPIPSAGLSCRSARTPASRRRLSAGMTTHRMGRGPRSGPQPFAPVFRKAASSAACSQLRNKASKTAPQYSRMSSCCRIGWFPKRKRRPCASPFLQAIHPVGSRNGVGPVLQHGLRTGQREQPDRQGSRS